MIDESIYNNVILNKNVGAMLSGGLDSSILVWIVSKMYKDINKESFKTFSVKYKDNNKHFVKNDFEQSEDSEYIKLMVDKLSLNHTEIEIDTPELFDSLEDALIARDMPGMADIDSSLYVFSKRIKESVDTVISGECSDEIFGGYPWFKEKIDTFPWYRNIELRNSLLNEKYQTDYKTYIQDLFNKVLNNTHVNEYDFEHDIKYKQVVQLNLHYFMQTLIDRNDRMASAFGLDVRVPFCDINVFNYVYSIPKSFKSVNSKEKGILREAFKDLLPIEIIERTKSPFPKTYDPKYLETLRNELYNLNHDCPLWKLFNREMVLNYFKIENYQPWYGQLMTTPQTIAYFLQINYWLKKYKIQIQ